MANYYNKDLYKVLDVSFDASNEEIKASYRKLVRQYHPDVSKNPNDAIKFKEIQEAYEILIDEEARKKYDVLVGFYTQKIKKKYQERVDSAKNRYETYIKKEKSTSKKQNFSESINDALDSLFYGKKLNKEDFQNEKTKGTPINGENINIDLTISCFEAMQGTNRKVNILHTEPCPKCGGRKFINGTECNMCKGTGQLSTQKKINVKIPKGVTTGSKVRIAKEGNKGQNGGKDGDLYLIITVDKHPFYEIDGLNILCNLPITPFEAVLGTEVLLPVSDGVVNLKVPPMTSSGQKLKVANQGLENKNKTKKGDIIVTIQIKLPKELSEKELELYNQLKNLSNDDIRKDFKNAK